MNWKEEYISMIGCVNVEDLKIEAAQSLKIANLPHHLYKYRAVSACSLDNLENDTVWLNEPKEYNDPFEFAEYMNFSKMNKSISKKINAQIIQKFTSEISLPQDVIELARSSEDPLLIMMTHHLRSSGKNEEEIKKTVDILNRASEKVAAQGNFQHINSMQDTMKVCSFCESPSHLLMWSHYADYHKGFCVEYDISKWPLNDVRKRILYPVIYQADIYDSTDHLLNQMNNGTFNNLYPIISGATKSKEWEYEREWRFIFNIGKSFPKQNYVMNCQSKVYLGYRMPDQDKDTILNICKKKNIPTYQTKPRIDKYEVEFILI